MHIKLGLYRHYKGNVYQVLSIARHSETLEILVVYQALYGDYGIWVRPYDLFVGTLLSEGKEIKRFEFLQETLTITPTVRL